MFIGINLTSVYYAFFIFLIALNILFVGTMYNLWIVGKTVERDIPAWEGTKKSLIWLISWGVAVFLDLVVYAVVVLILKNVAFDSEGDVWWHVYMMSFFFTYFYWVALSIIYSFVKNFVKAKNSEY